jgi:hypothetical protein
MVQKTEEPEDDLVELRCLNRCGHTIDVCNSHIDTHPQLTVDKKTGNRTIPHPCDECKGQSLFTEADRIEVDIECTECESETTILMFDLERDSSYEFPCTVCGHETEFMESGWETIEVE